MLSNLECSILKELDRQNIKSDVISVVMNRLDTNDKKNDFLSFMIDNRNVLISLKDIFSELNLIAKYAGLSEKETQKIIENNK